MPNSNYLPCPSPDLELCFKASEANKDVGLTAKEQSAYGVVSTAIPTRKVKETKLTLWVRANPTVQKFYDKRARKALGTARVYTSLLHSYWTLHLSKRLPSVDAWIEEVKTQHESKDLATKRAWGEELEGFYSSRQLRRLSRQTLVAAVKAFFEDKVELSKHKFTLVSNEEAMAETESKESLSPLTKEEVKTIIDRSSPLYKAIYLTQLNGPMAVGELIYFSKRAYKYTEQIRAGKVPLKVSLMRSKEANN